MRDNSLSESDAPVQHTAISCSGTTTYTLIAAVTSRKIRVLSYNLVNGGTARSVSFTAGASTALTGVMQLAPNSGPVCSYNRGGWFQSAAGQVLSLKTDGTSAVGGHLSYQAVL